MTVQNVQFPNQCRDRIALILRQHPAGENANASTNGGGTIATRGLDHHAPFAIVRARGALRRGLRR